MVLEYHLASQASNLGKILLKGDDSEIFACADDLLLFLNHLQDFIAQNPKSKIPITSFSDILYQLESDPEAALQNNDVCTRLLNLLTKVAQR
jgi:hypothetical protein